MQTSKPQQKFTAGEGDDFPIREKVLQNGLRLSIVGNVEYRQENGSVADVKIGVACRQSGGIGFNRLRHGQSDDVQRIPILILGRQQGLVIAIQLIYIFSVSSKAQTTVVGLTKRARLSTCPSVSSPSISPFSQMMFLTPR